MSASKNQDIQILSSSRSFRSLLRARLKPLHCWTTGRDVQETLMGLFRESGFWQGKNTSIGVNRETFVKVQFTKGGLRQARKEQ